MRIVRPVVWTMGGLRHTVRDFGRMREVAAVLARYGFGILVQNLNIPGARNHRVESDASTPERISLAMQELGPTFIKLGQILSTRGDLLPQPYIEALQCLQDDTAPVAVEEIFSVMTRELGSEWRDLIEDFTDTPLATASIAQVHRATLKDGREVVFKVQRPRIERKINADISILEFLVNRMVTEFPETSYFDPMGIVAAFKKAIHAELDFCLEAKNISEFSRNFALSESIVIPEVVSNLSTSRVLCISYLDGVSIREARDTGVDMGAVGQHYLKMAYQMIFEDGYFHSDLHPGNVLVLKDGRLGLLDFGMTGRLTREMRDNLVTLIFALERGDCRTIARIFYDIADKEGRVNYAQFEADTVELIQNHWSNSSIAEIQLGKFLTDLAQGAMHHRVKTPSSYTMLFKALITTEGLAKSILPEVDPVTQAQPYVAKLVAERYSPKRLQEDLFYHTITLNTFIRRLPTSASQLMDDLDNQRLKFNLNHIEEKETANARNRRSAALVFAVIAVGAALCGTLALDVASPTIFDRPMISTIFYAIAAPAGAVAASLSMKH